MDNKNLWGKILNIVITVLTAIATTFGITSCPNTTSTMVLPPNS